MVARIPLIVNSSAEQIQELPSGDSLSIPGDLDVTGSVTGSALHALKLTADGTIAANAPVILTSAGEVKAIETEAESFGSVGTFYTHGSADVKSVIKIQWDTSQNAAIVNWTDSNDARKISIGTLSGSTMTWASPVSQSFGDEFTPAIASNGEGGGIIIWRQSSNSGDAYGGDLLYQTFTLSGSTMTLGTIVRTLSPYSLNTNDAQDRFYVTHLEKEGSSHYFVYTHRHGSTSVNGQRAKMRIIKWDGQNNVTLGAEVAYENATATSNSDRNAINPLLVTLEYGRYLLYDRTKWKVCTRVGTDFRIGPTNGTSGIEIVGATSVTDTNAKIPVYDPRTKYLLSVNTGVSPAGVVVYSVDAENLNYRFQVNLPTGVGNGHVVVTDKGQILYSYMDGSTGANAKQLVGTFNEAKDYVTWSGPTGSWASNADNLGNQPRIVKADDGKVVKVFWSGASGDRDGKSVVVQTATTTLTSDNFLGFSAAGYSDGNTASISILGSKTTQSGLTTGKKYYVQDNGTIGIGKSSLGVVAGKALSATSLLITPV